MVLEITVGGNAGQGCRKGHLMEEVGVAWLGVVWVSGGGKAPMGGEDRKGDGLLRVRVRLRGGLGQWWECRV